MKAVSQAQLKQDWDRFVKDVGGLPKDKNAADTAHAIFMAGYGLACERLGVTINAK
jgi:hypothetical protein